MTLSPGVRVFRFGTVPFPAGYDPLPVGGIRGVTSVKRESWVPADAPREEIARLTGPARRLGVLAVLA
jgi:hypothetical protein